MNVKLIKVSIWVTAFIAPFLVLSGCGGENARYPIIINLKVVSGNTDVEIDGSGYTDGEGTSFAVSKFQILLSDIHFARAVSSSSLDMNTLHSGSKNVSSTSEIASYHFFDLADSTTHTIEAMHFSNDVDFSALDLTLGLVADSNTASSLPNETVYNNFAWPNQLGGGYHYLKFEGTYEDGGPQAFVVHSGPTMGTDYSTSISLPAEVSVVDGKIVINLTIDLNGIFSSPNDFSFDVIPSMIMMNASAQQTLKENSASGVFSISNTSSSVLNKGARQ